MVEPDALLSLPMDSASLELTYHLMILSEGRTISARCVGAHMALCIEGISHGHVRLMQFHEAFACLDNAWRSCKFKAESHGRRTRGLTLQWYVESENHAAPTRAMICVPR